MITQEIKDELTAAGCNYAALAERFMNMDKMAEKFLKKFLTDKNMELFEEKLSEGDAAGIFAAAHTLKGLCANLCMESMLKVLDPVVETARGGQLNGIAEAYASISEIYNKLCVIIKKMD